MSDFDIEGARKAGYSDAEIVDYLGKQSNFDVGAARKAGYSDADLISHLNKVAVPPPAENVTAGGVQDYEPMASRQHVGTTERPRHASDWLGSRLVNVATGIAGIPNALATGNKWAAETTGLPLDKLNYLNPIQFAGSVLPSGADMRDFVRQKIGMPTVNTPGKAGKVLDTAVETMLGGAAGGPRAILPAFMGGAGSEVAGQATHGTPYEPVARIVGGVTAGGLTALGQNAAGNVLTGIKNTVGTKDVDKQAAKILGRALNNDKMTMDELVAGQSQLPQGAPVALAGGENVKGALRGSVAAPGPARATAANAFDEFNSAGESRTRAAVDKNVSDLPPVSTRVDALKTERATESAPAYEAAGIPRNRSEFPNAPQISPLNDDLIALIDSSPDVRAAIAKARRVPELKDLPVNSMPMMDRVYKYLGDMEQVARGQRTQTRAGDIGDIRTRWKQIITSENKAYGTALETYSEPSKLIDAANLGGEMFRKNVNAEEVKRVFTKMPDDQKAEFLGGVADFLRTKIGNTDRAAAAERIWNSGNVRERLQAILTPEQFAAFKASMEGEKKAIGAYRDIFKGSRTTPMALEAEDNAAQIGNVLSKVARGRPVSAALDFSNQLLGRVIGRVGEGRTQAVNNVLADWLSSADPQKVGLVKALAAQAQAKEAVTAAGRQNALLYGAGAPVVLGAGR